MRAPALGSKRLHALAFTARHPVKTLRFWRLLSEQREMPGVVQQHAPADMLFTKTAAADDARR